MKVYNQKRLFLNNDELQNLFFNKTPFIDLRAPVEFAQGHLPNAINLPILNNEERALIGTTYKKQGRETAIKLGYDLVSGEVKKARVQKWLEFINKNPAAILYCFRGGLRSQISQKWLKESGQDVSLIEGGYKKARNFLIEETNKFSETKSMIILSGKTGSGKTTFLNQVKSFYPTLDLEELAKHRGSAFGSTDFEQPTQTNFENLLSVALINLKDLQKKLLVEDESKLIGSRALPKSFFEKMRVSPVLWVEETIENRVNNIFQTYVVEAMREKESSKILNVFSKYKASVLKISNKLGGLRAQEILNLLNNSESDFLQTGSFESNKLWIEKLLVYYYDPLYLSSIEKREVNYIFKGTRLECESFLTTI